MVVQSMSILLQTIKDHFPHWSAGLSKAQHKRSRPFSLVIQILTITFISFFHKVWAHLCLILQHHINFKSRFSVGLILEDASDETNAMIIVKAAEQLFGISCYHLVVEKGFTRQEFRDAILRVRGHYKLYESNC